MTVTRESVAVAPARAPSQSGPNARRRFRISKLLLGGNAALVFGLLYLPVVILVIFSFNSTRSVAVFGGFSTEWYTRLSENRQLLDSARNSLLVGLVATVASTIIGTMTALAMDRYRFRLRTAFDANLYLPIVIPEIVMGISLLLFFNQALFPLMKSVLGIRAQTGLTTIMIAHIAFDIPFVYVIVRARLADFDRTLEEAAQDLGADEMRTFQRITLPLLMPGIIGGALMAFTLSLDDYLITAFTKGVRDETMPIYIYGLVRRGVTPEINALSTLLLGGSIGLVGLSQLAQSGGALYTRAMSVGAGLGAGLFGLVGLTKLPAELASGPTAIVGQVILLVGFLLAWKSARGYAEEFRLANKAARWLSLFSIMMLAMAAYLSILILST